MEMTDKDKHSHLLQNMIHSGGIQPCSQILDWGGSNLKWQNTLAFFCIKLITAVKIFMIQAPAGYVLELSRDG